MSKFVAILFALAGLAVARRLALLRVRRRQQPVLAAERNQYDERESPEGGLDLAHGR